MTRKPSHYRAGCSCPSNKILTLLLCCRIWVKNMRRCSHTVDFCCCTHHFQITERWLQKWTLRHLFISTRNYALTQFRWYYGLNCLMYVFFFFNCLLTYSFTRRIVVLLEVECCKPSFVLYCEGTDIAHTCYFVIIFSYVWCQRFYAWFCSHLLICVWVLLTL